MWPHSPQPYPNDVKSEHRTVGIDLWVQVLLCAPCSRNAMDPEPATVNSSGF